MAKSYKKDSEFSRDREFTVILEDLRSQFRVFGEGMEVMRTDLTDVRNRVGRIEVKVDHLEIEMVFVRKVLSTVATKDDLKQFEKRVTILEASR